LALDDVETFDRRKPDFREDRFHGSAFALLFAAADDDGIALRELHLDHAGALDQYDSH
jgi:hypothetical protein